MGGGTRPRSPTPPLAGGLPSPDDIAGVAAFLVSDAATMITGQHIAVDGGWGGYSDLACLDNLVGPS